LIAAAVAAPLNAENIRVCIFHTELERKAPGLLYRGVLQGEDDVSAAASRVAMARCEILLLLDFDFDHHLLTLKAFADLVQDHGGPDYPHAFALRPNTGRPSFVDLNMDGRLGTPKDAQGYGRFSGQGGMALLSTYPMRSDRVEDHSAIPWAEVEWAELPQLNGVPFYSPEVNETLRLSTTGHWVVPIAISETQSLHLLAYHASPPAFDGPENRNGLRNADETRFWARYLDNRNVPIPVVVGGANLDPHRGDGNHDAIRELISHPALQDPFENGFSTVDWTDIGLGLMRSDYVLPSANLSVTDAGAVWGDISRDIESRHAVVWVDLELPTPAAPVMLETSAMTQ